MTRFAATRALQALAVLAVVSFLVYMLLGLMPGDPVDLMIAGAPDLSAADAARLRSLHGLDRPLIARYVAWAADALTGDFGHSRGFSRPVLEVLLPRLANTAVLVAAALVLALAIALPVGVMAATRRHSLADHLVNLACFAGVSVPPFLMALTLIIVFAVNLNWLPASGLGPPEAGTADQIAHLILPVTSLTALSVAAYTRHVRAAMIAELGQDYVRTARAKGLDRTTVVWRHALRNGMVPVVTILALDLGTLFGGALVIETVFAYPGMGKLIYDAVVGSDYNLALVGLLFTTATILVAAILADLAYAALDPRIRIGAESA